MRVTIYISLWTNYNDDICLIKLNYFWFTFHYELIITYEKVKSDSYVDYLHFTMN